MLANPQKAHLFSVKMMRIDTVAGLLTTALSRTYPPLLPPHIQEMFQNPNGMLPHFLFFWCAKHHILTYAPLKCLFTLDTPPPPYSCAMLMLMLRARALYSKTSKKHSYANTSRIGLLLLFPLLKIALSPSACSSFTFFACVHSPMRLIAFSFTSFTCLVQFGSCMQSCLCRPSSQHFLFAYSVLLCSAPFLPLGHDNTQKHTTLTVKITSCIFIRPLLLRVARHASRTEPIPLCRDLGCLLCTGGSTKTQPNLTLKTRSLPRLMLFRPQRVQAQLGHSVSDEC